MTRKAQRHEELTTFLTFADSARLKLQRSQTRSAVEPQPDIHCRTKAGEVLRFELVELKKGASAQNEAVAIAVQRHLMKTADGLPAEQRDAIKDACAGALITVGMAIGATRNTAIGDSVAIFNILSSCCRGDTRYITVDSPAHIRRSFAWIRVHPHPLRSYGGYEFQVLDANVDAPDFCDWVAPIEKHLRKSYETAGDPLELLAWSRAFAGPAGWQGALTRLLVERLSNSPFRRLWVYDMFEREVLYVHPPPDPAMLTP